MASDFGLKSLAILALVLAVCVQGSLGKKQWTLSYWFSDNFSYFVLKINLLGWVFINYIKSF